VPLWPMTRRALSAAGAVALLLAMPLPAGAADRVGVVVTSVYAPQRTVSGLTSVDHFGRVVTMTGDPVVGVQLDLAIVPDIGPVRIVKATTGPSGGWARTGERPMYSATIRTYFPGTAEFAPAFSTSYRLPVSPQLTITSPTDRTPTSSRSRLVVRGLVSPAKPGATVSLLRFDGHRFVVVAHARVVGNGYAFAAALPRGKHTLRVSIGRTDGNWLGYSPAFGADRT
jgi:hypothetical protein